jgi:hypothetical protein
MLACTGSRTKRTVLAATAAGALATVAAGGAATAAAARPAADCAPYSHPPCLLPFPNNLFTRPDRTTPTGLRIHLPANAMPANDKGRAIGVAQYNRNDGFSPGSALVVHVPGLDNAAALARTRPVRITDVSKSFARLAPIVVIDEQTGRRKLIWSELDANARTPQTKDLLIHPGKDFTEGHTYVVALRNLRNAGGRLIGAPSWFAALRDNRGLTAALRSQRTRYARIFTALKRAGVGRASNLYEAWDFTIASRQSLTNRMLAIRNAAFAQLGDGNLADGTVTGRAPAFSVASADTSLPGFTRVQGTFTVPCYLVACGATATTGFHYGSSKPDARPTQVPGNNAIARFECIIPSTADAAHPARISLYGHGLLGSRDEVEAGNVQAMAREHNFVFCATDWWGLASGDTGYDASALGDLNLFPAVVDRLQQGVLNTLFLGRLMLNPGGLASNAAFEQSGRPLIDTSHLYYDGNSQGGIMGGMTTAVAPDFRRAVLGVSGMNYANVLVQRSTDFAPFGTILGKAYSDPSLTPVILDLMQQLWDRGDPDGYAQQMTANPLPDTPSHTVLMQIAYGDHQVSMYAAAVEARTIGAAVHVPALGADRARDKNLFFGVPTIGRYPFSGSAITIWDDGPGNVKPPPLANLAPVNSATNKDPHEDVRNTVAARTQKSDFLEANGSVVDVCAGKPCRTDVFKP